MTRRTRRVLVYGDVNLNIIDGSSVWVQSIALALSAVPRTEVHVLLKATPENERLLRQNETTWPLAPDGGWSRASGSTLNRGFCHSR